MTPRTLPPPTAVFARYMAILRGGFALIALAFLLVNLIALVEIESVQARNRRIVDEAFSRLALISRVTHDLDQKRLLVDAHVFASVPETRKSIEARLAGLDVDRAEASRAYETIPKSPDERARYQELRQAIAEVAPRMDRVLALSRMDQDADAIIALEGAFAAIDDAGARLLQITSAEADRGLVRVHEHQHEANVLLAAITLGGTALAVIVAVAVLRALRRGDAQVRRSAELLEQRNRELNAFAGRLAHDLRGPLTTIGLSASTLAASMPAGDKALAILDRAAGRMNELIEDLLTLSRIDAEAPGATSSTADVVAALEEEVRPSMVAANGRLHVDVQPAEVAAGPGLLRQVLWQVVDNAVKYRRAEVDLELSIVGRDLGRRYRFEITDNGSGMTPEEVRRACEPLFRGEQAAQLPGTGIGLTIVKRMVEASGGTVSISSAPQRGTTVTIEMPRRD